MRPIAELTEQRISEYVDRLVDQDKLPRSQAEEAARNTVELREDQWHRTIPARLAHARAHQLDGPLAAAVAAWRAEPWRNLVLLGAVGVGKTHAAAAAAHLAVMDGWRARFYPVVDLLDALRPGSEGEGATVLENCKAVDLLVLDDLGAERPTDWTAERLYALVNRRWLEQRPTIVTSNLSAQGGKGPFVDAVGTRMYSRLVHDAVVAQAAGGDRRRS